MKWYCFAAGAIALACLIGSTAMAEGPATSSTHASVGAYDVFEVTLTSNAKFADPFVDAKVSATFTSPAGRKVEVPGFYDGDGRWMVRFAPGEMGMWKYSARLDGGKTPVTAAGQVLCGASKNHGFLRVSKVNPYRLQHDDGTAFYPIGIHLTSGLQPDFDGPDEDGNWRTVDLETWCKAFAGAVNLHRVQLGLGDRRGCAIPVLRGIEDGRVEYDLDLAGKLDDLYRTHRRYGIAQMLILYQDMSLWGNAKTPFGMGRDTANYKSLRAKNLPLQENYIRYIVARYGAFVDVWEIYNEDAYSPDDYLAHLARVIREADPYDHIITTNYERPTEPWCEMVTPHEYIGVPASQTEAYLATQLLRFKSFGKPVQYTEFGNQGILSNVDPIKYRVAVWTAYMNECGILFWGMSGKKTKGNDVGGGNANAYIGPEDRKHFRILQDFTRDLPVDMRPVASGYTDQQHLHTYALGNRKTTVLYVHHYANHSESYQLPDPLFVGTGPGKFRFRWIDPATGETVKEGSVVAEMMHSKIALPPVKIDLACRFDRQE